MGFVKAAIAGVALGALVAAQGNNQALEISITSDLTGGIGVSQTLRCGSDHGNVKCDGGVKSVWENAGTNWSAIYIDPATGQSNTAEAGLGLDFACFCSYDGYCGDSEAFGPGHQGGGDYDYDANRCGVGGKTKLYLDSGAVWSAHEIETKVESFLATGFPSDCYVFSGVWTSGDNDGMSMGTTWIEMKLAPENCNRGWQAIDYRDVEDEICQDSDWSLTMWRGDGLTTRETLDNTNSDNPVYQLSNAEAATTIAECKAVCDATPSCIASHFAFTTRTIDGVGPHNDDTDDNQKCFLSASCSDLKLDPALGGIALTGIQVGSVTSFRPFQDQTDPFCVASSTSSYDGTALNYDDNGDLIGSYYYCINGGIISGTRGNCVCTCPKTHNGVDCSIVRDQCDNSGGATDTCTAGYTKKGDYDGTDVTTQPAFCEGETCTIAECCTANQCTSGQRVANSVDFVDSDITGTTTQTVDVACAEGWQANGASIVCTCGTDGNFMCNDGMDAGDVVAEACGASTCTAGLNVANSDYAVTEMNAVTTASIEVNCDVGWQNNGATVTHTCMNTGSFSGDICDAEACTQNLNVANSDYATTQMSATTSVAVTVACDQGYHGADGASATQEWMCNPNSAFSGTECIATTCTTNLNVANSNYATDNMNAATTETVTVTCDQGYYGTAGNDATQEWTCNPDGGFTGTDCIATYCTVDAIVANSVSYSSTAISNVATTETVDVACAQGYAGNGATVVHTCQEDGSFTGDACAAGACVATASDSDVDGLDGNYKCVDGDISGVSGSCVCTCHIGYVGDHCDTDDPTNPTKK